jgi:hypothetical protein
MKINFFILLKGMFIELSLMKGIINLLELNEKKEHVGALHTFGALILRIG